ncbi:MAG: hypothetical protein LWY06_16980 [Firmicutes bacterium]|nr:hypothetical protein [Bacillota bacterium]
MDSLFDENKNKKKKKKGDQDKDPRERTLNSFFEESLKKDEERYKERGEEPPEREEAVVVIRQSEIKEEADEERKKRLAELMPDEVFMTPKTPTKKPVWTNCLFMFCVGFLIVLLAAVLWSLQFFGRDLIASYPTKHADIQLSKSEQFDLDKKIIKYNEAMEDVKAGREIKNFEIALTGNQLNYLLQQFEESISSDRKIVLRAYPNGSQVSMFISFPFEKKGFLNVQLVGKPIIEAYLFNMDVFTIQIGSMKNASGFKKKILDRINRDLDQYPRTHGVPFRVHDMTVEDSIFHFTLSLKE